MLPLALGGSSDGAGGGAPRAMLLAGAPLAARQEQRNLARDCERCDRQLDGPNAPGWVAREERAATSVRRAGGEATVWALDSAVNVQICPVHGSSAQTVASAAARFAGRGPFLALRRCEGERTSCDDLDLLHGSWSHESRLVPRDCALLVRSA
jgi:hypothetical protein